MECVYFELTSCRATAWHSAEREAVGLSCMMCIRQQRIFDQAAAQHISGSSADTVHVFRFLHGGRICRLHGGRVCRFCMSHPCS